MAVRGGDGKHQKRGVNLQVIASPRGDILWVFGALPGSVHDKKAEWMWGVLARLYLRRLRRLRVAGEGNRPSRRQGHWGASWHVTGFGWLMRYGTPGQADFRATSIQSARPVNC